MAAHRYWRLFVFARYGNDGWVSCSELGMRTTPGGSSVCTGGTPIGVYTAPYTLAQGFDGNTSTVWAKQMAADAQYLTGWLGYDFGAGNEKDIVEISYRCHNSYTNEAMKQAFVEWSDDGTQWYFAWHINDASAWSGGQTKVYTKPTIDLATPHRYWRALVVATFDNTQNQLIIAELELRSLTGGADLSSGGTPLGTAGGTLANAFDDNAATTWAVTWASEAADPSFIGYDFGAGNAYNIQEITIQANNNGSLLSRTPKHFAMQYSDDNSTWVGAWGTEITSTFTAGEVKTFTSQGYAAPVTAPPLALTMCVT